MTSTPIPLRPRQPAAPEPWLRLVADDERLPSPAGVATPVRMLVDGVPLLVARPARQQAEAVHDGAHSADQQPMLPLRPMPPPAGDAAGAPDDGPDTSRAERWVAGLAQAVCEVIGRRRPAHQLRGTLDEESLALVAAWARLGTVQPRVADRPRLHVVAPTRIEARVPCMVRGRRLAMVVALERHDERWACTAFRLLAPRALVTAAA